MKKIKIGIIALSCTAVLATSGCACNKSIIDLNYKFDKATVCQKDGFCRTYDIRKWDDYGNDAICVWTTDGQVIYGSMENITLYGES